MTTKLDDHNTVESPCDWNLPSRRDLASKIERQHETILVLAVALMFFVCMSLFELFCTANH